MKTIQKIIPVLLILFFISCNNENKVESKIKKEVVKTTKKVDDAIAKERLDFDYKLEHLQTLADLERMKIHFVEETNKFKLENDINKLKQRLSKLKTSTNTEFNKTVSEIETHIRSLETSIKNEDNTAKEKLEKLSKLVDKKIEKMDESLKTKDNQISSKSKIQYYELKAKIDLRKAKNAILANDFDKANNYLKEALENYEIAKKYGDAPYKTKISNLQNQIKTLMSTVNAEKSTQLEIILIDIE